MLLSLASKLATLPLLGSLLQLAGPSSSALAKRDDFLPARVPYVLPEPGANPVADDIRSRRENGTLLALDGVLLNAPMIAENWNNFFGIIRSKTTIPGDMRELVILRIATLNKAAYEWLQHESVGRAEGLTTSQLQAVRFTPSMADASGQAYAQLQAQLKETLGPQLAAALEFTDWSTRGIQVPQEVFDATKQALGNDNQKLVELAATCGGYNFVSRFLVSLNIDGKEEQPVPIPSSD